MAPCAALLCALLAAAPAAAQGPLSEAEAATDAGDFERAQQLLEAIVHDGARLPTDVARAYVLLGIVRATLGDDAAADQAFEWALALDPGMPTPAELGPTQRDRLDAIRARRAGRALSVSLRAPDDVGASETWSIAASLDGVPLGETLDVEIVAWPDDDESLARSAHAAGNAVLEIPAGAWPDAHEIHVRTDVRSAGGPSLVHDDARVRRRAGAGHGTPVYEEAWFWVVIGVVVAAAIVTPIVVTTTSSGTTLGPPELIP